MLLWDSWDFHYWMDPQPLCWSFLRKIKFLLFKEYGKKYYYMHSSKKLGRWSFVFLMFVTVDVQICCWSEVCLRQDRKVCSAMLIQNQSLCTCTAKNCVLLMSSNLMCSNLNTKYQVIFNPSKYVSRGYFHFTFFSLELQNIWIVKY